jgi:hypothetical protein
MFDAIELAFPPVAVASSDDVPKLGPDRRRLGPFLRDSSCALIKRKESWSDDRVSVKLELLFVVRPPGEPSRSASRPLVFGAQIMWSRFMISCYGEAARSDQRRRDTPKNRVDCTRYEFRCAALQGGSRCLQQRYYTSWRITAVSGPTRRTATTSDRFFCNWLEIGPTRPFAPMACHR